MNSTIKNDLNTEEIEKIVKHNIDEQICINNIEYIDTGMMNAVYSMQLQKKGANDNPIILKVSFCDEADVLSYEKGIMVAEIAFYKYMQGKNIPIPKLIAYDTTKHIIASNYFIMSQLSGETWKNLKKSLSTEQKEKLKYELGRYSAMIHQVKGEYFGYIRNNSRWRFNKWETAFSVMVEELIKEGIARHIHLPYEKIRNVMSEYKYILNEITTPKLVNFDMWEQNILLDQKEDGEYYISGIIDFERCFFGDPMADFVASIGIYEDVTKEHCFLNGYEKEIEKKMIFTKNDQIRMYLYRIYMYLNQGIETYRFEEKTAKQTLRLMVKCIDYTIIKINKC